MSSKLIGRAADGSGRPVFSGFKMANNGAMVVERSKLHASEGYRRQVQALAVLKQHRTEKAK
jgi:hypothetical protein